MRRKKRNQLSVLLQWWVWMCSLFYIYTHTQLIHFAQQKPTQGCKPISLQWKQSNTKEKVLCLLLIYTRGVSSGIIFSWEYVNEEVKWIHLIQLVFREWWALYTNLLCAESLQSPLSWPGFQYSPNQLCHQWYVNYTSTSPIGGLSPRQRKPASWSVVQTKPGVPCRQGL